MHLAVDGRGGAPVKSFAQAFSFLRESLEATCAHILTLNAHQARNADAADTAPDNAAETTAAETTADAATAAAAAAASPAGSFPGGGVAACVREIEAALEAAALRACPSREPLWRPRPEAAATPRQQDEMHARIGSPGSSDRPGNADNNVSSRSSSSSSDTSHRRGGGAVIHVRSLAGDELEHYWHFFVGELLPACAAALQALSQLPPPAWAMMTSSAAAAEGPVLTVVVHNPLRPWGASPLHRFYAELSEASGGALAFEPSPLDCANADADADANAADANADDAAEGESSAADVVVPEAAAAAVLRDSGNAAVVRCEGAAVVRLPRWDYEAASGDAARLAQAADLAAELLRAGSSGRGGVGGDGEGLARRGPRLRAIVRRVLGEEGPGLGDEGPGLGDEGSASVKSNSECVRNTTSSGTSKRALTMVVQQRSHDAALGYTTLAHACLPRLRALHLSFLSHFLSLSLSLSHTHNHTHSFLLPFSPS